MNDYANRECENDLPEETVNNRSNDTIDLTIGVFFDGTKNNKYNIDYTHKGGKEIDDSYRSSYTNVATMWNGYDSKNPPLIAKVYVEGIGTVSPIGNNSSKSKDEEGLTSSQKKDDTIQGSGFGYGSNGINAKIERGCKLIAAKVNQLLMQKECKPATIRTLFIDVFGFSRGAAAARSFASRLIKNVGSINEKKKVCLKAHLTHPKLANVKFEVRFMGLFDTVSSYNNGFSLSPDFSNDVEELALTIPKEVKQVVQLAAADEYRKNFALTNIQSAGSSGMEIVLPGAHSDIGGGYPPNEAENIYMNGVHSTGHRRCRGYKSLKELYDENWLPSNWFVDRPVFMADGSVKSTTPQNRGVQNDYARIPLQVMYDHATEKGVVFQSQILKDLCEINPIYTDLIKLKSRIVELSKSGKGLYQIQARGFKGIGSKEDQELVNKIRARFIHLSAFKSGGIHSATNDNQRTIYPG
ncbi:MAG: DUF2235 domain-containing protein [Parabacteroides sp.]|nr:DUF2235 domain-containing protein [Bacteroidales bacterium]MCC8171288.1 DUF2235 domain-containing protein [Parabacteroides sp.]